MRYYTEEKNAQVVIALLKAHGIKNIVASPGATNVVLVASLQGDPYFSVYSSVDERSAAYMACGLAAETGRPVVLSCTGATASRNYVPGLTEAYYRKLPVLAITSSQMLARVGQHVAQVIDRSSIQNDIAKISVALPLVKDADDLWDCEVKTNKAILELKRNGGGPAHINLITNYSSSYDVRVLPEYRVIDRIEHEDEFPPIAGKVAVFVGSHKIWSKADTEALDSFCAAHNGVVFCDHTSGYRGKYRLVFALPAGQEALDRSAITPDILIHIGEISGDYETLGMAGKQVWRVSPDGEIRDTFRKLRYVFEMSERHFFSQYAAGKPLGDDSYFRTCAAILEQRRASVPDLPFSNIWVASQMAPRIPQGAAIHFGILNSLRSWNFFELPPSVTSSSNVGGFGIDGCMSSLVGASLADKDKLYFIVLGDLAFFYDMNVAGNRHVGKNIRIMVVNNGKGTEFTQYNHNAAQLGRDAEVFVAAAGHFGNKSKNLVKNYAENLGFEYIAASSKEEFLRVYERFISPGITDKPMIFEVFTDGDLESRALEMIKNIDKSPKTGAKKIVKDMLGRDGIRIVKRLMGR